MMNTALAAGGAIKRSHIFSMSTLASMLQGLLDKHKDDPEKARLAKLAKRESEAFAYFEKKMKPRLPGALQEAAASGRNYLDIGWGETWHYWIPEDYHYDLDKPGSPFKLWCKENGFRLSYFMLHRSVAGWRIYFAENKQTQQL